jgi:hypothetical protein
MEIKKGPPERFDSIKGERSKEQNLLAFRDFCLDFFGNGDCSDTQGSEAGIRTIDIRLLSRTSSR